MPHGYASRFGDLLKLGKPLAARRFGKVFKRWVLLIGIVLCQVGIAESLFRGIITLEHEINHGQRLAYFVLSDCKCPMKGVSVNLNLISADNLRYFCIRGDCEMHGWFNILGRLFRCYLDRYRSKKTFQRENKMSRFPYNARILQIMQRYSFLVKTRNYQLFILMRKFK